MSCRFRLPSEDGCLPRQARGKHKGRPTKTGAIVFLRAAGEYHRVFAVRGYARPPRPGGERSAEGHDCATWRERLPVRKRYFLRHFAPKMDLFQTALAPRMDLILTVGE